MKRFHFVFLAVCFVLVSTNAFFSVSPAHAIQCSIARPKNAQLFWSYRLIDGQKCWYEGKPMLSKSLLEWPSKKLAEQTSKSEPSPASSSGIENSVMLNDSEG